MLEMSRQWARCLKNYAQALSIDLSLFLYYQLAFHQCYVCFPRPSYALLAGNSIYVPQLYYRKDLRYVRKNLPETTLRAILLCR